MAIGQSIDHGFPAYPFRRPKEMAADGGARLPVAIVGGGPVGLTFAAGLARYGVPCAVVEPRDSVSFGSRAACISRRSLEILESFGAADGFLAKGLPWTGGRSFWRGRDVLSFAMPTDDDQKHPPMINLQQCFAEQVLVDHAAGLPSVDIRWQSRVTGIDQEPDAVRLTIETPEGRYGLDADYVVATDGARSFVRQALGLHYEGSSYEGRYLIADIKLASDQPTERRAWFDPSSNPGSTVLMHRQPEDIWRIDYQLRDDEDDQAEVQEARVRARVDAHLRMIGERPDYELIWISLYKAHTLTLPRYRHGRVLFAGDAAHLVPIFGVRGLNSGIDDAGNLAWKLAAVVEGRGGDRLLESYSEERVFAARENIRQARKSTLFMTPPSRGFTLMREAALSLAVSNAFARPLANPRQTTAIAFPSSPLQTEDDAPWPDGPPPGTVLPTFPVGIRSGNGAWNGHLLIGPAPTVVQAAGDTAAEAHLARRVAAGGVRVVLIASGDRTELDGMDVALDARRRAPPLLGLDVPGAGYLVRPDGHVAARWRAFAPAAFDAAHGRALGREG